MNTKRETINNKHVELPPSMPPAPDTAPGDRVSMPPFDEKAFYRRLRENMKIYSKPLARLSLLKNRRKGNRRDDMFDQPRRMSGERDGK